MSSLVRELERVIGQLPGTVGVNRDLIESVLSTVGQIQSIVDASTDNDDALEGLRTLQARIGELNIPILRDIAAQLPVQNIDPTVASGVMGGLRQLFTHAETALTGALRSLNMDDRTLLGVLEQLNRQTTSQNDPEE